MGDEHEDRPFIHGSLEVTIHRAEHLHHTIIGLLFQAIDKVEEILHLGSHKKLYATVDIGSARIARTREVGFHPSGPTWNESFKVYTAHTASTLTISIKQQLPVSAKVLGRAHIPISRILTSKLTECWLQLVDEEGKEIDRGRVKVSLKFNDVKYEPFWDSGIKLDEFRGIPNAFFPERRRCGVTLYQNSHLSNKFQPKIELAGGEKYEPPRLWEDLYNGIMKAKHFVYVAGWSVNVRLTLIRDPERKIPENVSIGELLIKKAEAGVKVLVMVWEDRTSIPLLHNVGLMNTHDNDTYDFFEHSKVKCFRCPRNPDGTLTAIQSVEVYTEFTHHQKIILLDAPVSSSDPAPGRKLVAFVGGIDLTDGRYDDENHSLFGNLDTIYANDFLQNNFPCACLKLGGPREPWHDVHSMVEGLAAWDVLTNYEHRWMKQAPKELTGDLLEIQNNLLTFPPVPDESDTTWNVQVFRSIDDSSVVGFPSDPEEASRKGLVSRKDVTVDQSIQSGYIEAIRRAKRFIYIENQYFSGGCSSWSNGDEKDRDCGCLNLIPMELALKIASKIEKKERFAVYVVMPMWPEGKPEGYTVQAILHWTWLTMEKMYEIVDMAIEKADLRGKVHPCDYLNFYCLGNRETKRPGEYKPGRRPNPESDYWLAQMHRRFLIYVHAKIMIVDDEYVILGSANLNQRSLEGDRDTEIVHGSYQPTHLNNNNGGHARGQVYGYRMSLWYEHFMSHNLNQYHTFVEPETVECVRTVNKIAKYLWEKFVASTLDHDLPGHLLPFPIRVSETGQVSEMTTNGYFPDTTAPIKGRRPAFPPSILTT